MTTTHFKNLKMFCPMRILPQIALHCAIVRIQVTLQPNSCKLRHFLVTTHFVITVAVFCSNLRKVSYAFCNNRRTTQFFTTSCKMFLESCNTILFQRLGICGFHLANNDLSRRKGRITQKRQVLENISTVFPRHRRMVKVVF